MTPRDHRARRPPAVGVEHVPGRLGAGSEAVLVDAGAGIERLLARADELSLTVTHVLVTHRHEDHIEQVADVRTRFPDVEVLCHPAEREHVPEATGDLQPGVPLSIGGADRRRPRDAGPHARRGVPLIDGHLFSGDTLFRRSVGGIVSPGHTTFSDLRTRSWRSCCALRPRP